MSNRIVISETRTSTWHYHLREIPEGEEPNHNGLPTGTKALCGNDNLGWDTQIPLERWGHKSHIPTGWCAECARLAGLEAPK